MRRCPIAKRPKGCYLEGVDCAISTNSLGATGTGVSIATRLEFLVRQERSACHYEVVRVANTFLIWRRACIASGCSCYVTSGRRDFLAWTIASTSHASSVPEALRPDPTRLALRLQIVSGATLLSGFIRSASEIARFAIPQEGNPQAWPQFTTSKEPWALSMCA